MFILAQVLRMTLVSCGCPGLVTPASLGSLFSMQRLRLHPLLPKQDVHFNKIPRQPVCSLEIEAVPDPL